MTLKTNPKNTLVAAAIVAGIAGPIWAQSGDDPMSWIDIVIKQDPGGRSIRTFALDEGQVKAINALKGDDRPNYALKVIAEEIGAGKDFVAAGMRAFEGIWCGPCKMADEILVEFQTDDTAYSLTVSFKAGAELSEKH